ncbi:hypothetical protein HaLaN_10623 [Haematococcus lacustris]|uniref:Uncharacterized protein n=1 Tax=Haematococcus lacustris TaxID=44745 RepID=A0A699Z5J0_HAELA|nr:hypothetical protein HaLaN_10623 [Haematococcus lacustris]
MMTTPILAVCCCWGLMLASHHPLGVLHVLGVRHATAVYNDDGGPCGEFRSQLTITALAGQAYTAVVENYPFPNTFQTGGSFPNGDHDDVAIQLPFTYRVNAR